MNREEAVAEPFVWFPVTEVVEPTVADDAPVASSADPTWCDTWYVNGFDVDRRRFALAYVSWSVALQRGRCTMAVSEEERLRVLYTDTTVPLSNDLVDLTITPWSTIAIAAPALGIDLQFQQIGSPAEVAGVMKFGDGPSQAHLEAWGKTTGTIDGQVFAGVSGRDRSSGPRYLPNHQGRHVWISLTGDDGTTALVLFKGTTAGTARNAGPAFGFGVVRTALGDRNVNDWSVERGADGNIQTIDIDGDRLTVETSLVPVTLGLDQVSNPARSTTPVYSCTQRPVIVSSKQLGRLAGVVEQGHLQSF